MSSLDITSLACAGSDEKVDLQSTSENELDEAFEAFALSQGAESTTNADDAKSPPAKEKQGLSLPELVKAVGDMLEGSGGEKPIEKMRQLIEEYDATSHGDYKRYEFWDEEKLYTRNLIATTKTFTMLLLCWNPGKQSPVHDHAGSECWMRSVKGNAVEVRYKYGKDADAPLEETQRTVLKEGQCAFINDNIGLHKVENVSAKDKLITLHIYSPPFASCNVFLSKQCKATKACISYFSENGKKVEYD